MLAATNDGRYTVDSATGGTTPVVVENDTLNGQPVPLADVVLTVVTGATPGHEGALVPVLDPVTGVVTTPVGTPSGNYAITYQICLPGNSAVCAQATVTIEVTAPAISPDPLPPPSAAIPVPANNPWMLVLAALAVLASAVGVQRKNR